MRGYFYKRLNFRTNVFGEKYYLDFTPKANYYFFDKNGIPLVSYNNNNIYFPVTVINYFIGMLDSNKFTINELKILASFIKQHLNKDGFLLRHDFEEKNWNNKPIWYSNLPHAMLFSLLIRINIRIDIEKYLGKDLNFFYNSLFSKKIFDKENFIFVEYPSISSQPLNGQMFGLFAVYDAYQNQLEVKVNFVKAINSTLILLKKQITFFGWTMYNENRLASPFYHFLHISQFKVCEKIDSRFAKYRYKAQFALIFYPFVIIYKLYKKFL